MSFYFYDLETSGFSPKTDRIMQFAGQRTDMDLKPIGEPDNILIKMTADTLPAPDAVLIHGVTPQQTLSEGLSEADFLKYFHEHIAKPDTVFVGYNNIRFDDDFMRFTNWRNFYDAYEWAWKDGRSRWDLLDVARMTRALRPEGIKWSFAPDGKPSNRLELLSAVNKLDHANAHDALSDVKAVIAIAKLIKDKQPKLFDYLFNLRDKKKIAALVTKGEPFIYTSGRYPAEFEKTTIAVMVAAHPDRDAGLVYDLRVDPSPFIKMSPQELAATWQQPFVRGRTSRKGNQTGVDVRGPSSHKEKTNKDQVYFPVKILAYNRAPAIAPLSVLDAKSAVRLKLDSKKIDENLAKLQKAEDFGDKLTAALEIMRPKAQPETVVDPQKVDEQLYDGFVNDADKTKMSVVRAADANQLADLHLDFMDERLRLLLPLYKARNYPTSLDQDERQRWEDFRRQKLLGEGEKSPAACFFRRLAELDKRTGLTDQDRYLLEELNLYGQSLVPVE